MNDAPDTIWAYVAQRPRVGIWRHDNDEAVTVEYTRADLAEAAIEVMDVANKVAVTLIDQNAQLIKRIAELETEVEKWYEAEAEAAL
jgi:hypothetical protein